MREEMSLAEGLTWMVIVVLVYYAGTRGLLVATRRYAGRWYRRASVSFSFAVLFAPSITGVGHGGLIPVPAWAASIDLVQRGRWLDLMTWGLFPIITTWLVFFAVASLSFHMSKNKNNKADTHGKEP